MIVIPLFISHSINKRITRFNFLKSEVIDDLKFINESIIEINSFVLDKGVSGSDRNLNSKLKNLGNFIYLFLEAINLNRDFQELDNILKKTEKDYINFKRSCTDVDSIEKQKKIDNYEVTRDTLTNSINTLKYKIIFKK